jgi:hypothetical protein
MSASLVVGGAIFLARSWRRWPGSQQPVASAHRFDVTRGPHRDIGEVNTSELVTTTLVYEPRCQQLSNAGTELHTGGFNLINGAKIGAKGLGVKLTQSMSRVGIGRDARYLTREWLCCRGNRGQSR